MDNEPLMFIDSVNDIKEINSNQEVFDSRYQKRSLKGYRLQDIKAMLLYRINVLCEIYLFDDKIEGTVVELNDKYIVVDIEGIKKEILITEIKDINILKL